MVRDAAVLDDDPGFTSRCIEPLRDTVLNAVNVSGPEALRLIGEGQRYDVLLCSTRVPDMPTAAFYKALRAATAEQADRVIFLSGSVVSHVTSTLSDGTPHIVVSKSIEAHTFRRVLERFLALGRALERVPNPTQSAQIRQYGRILARKPTYPPGIAGTPPMPRRSDSQEVFVTLTIDEAVERAISVKIIVAPDGTGDMDVHSITGVMVTVSSAFPDSRERVGIRLAGDELMHWVAVDSITRVLPAPKSHSARP